MSGFSGVRLELPKKPLRAFRPHNVILNAVSLKPTQLYETGLQQRRETIKSTSTDLALHSVSIVKIKVGS